jgi:LysR family glycine cleavage system transcriptional activator
MKRKIPSLNALRSFEAAARLGSFRAAAEELCVSQSAISHQIKNLETYLGIELFLRMTRAVELTPAGKSYYPVLNDAFDRIHDGTRNLLRPLEKNILTVQLYSTFTVRWLMSRLKKFQDRYPDIQVRVNTSQSNVDFTQQGIDLGIIIGQRRQDEIHYEYMFSPVLIAVCSPNYMVNCQKFGPALTKPSDVSLHPILQVYPSENDWMIWLDANGVQDVDPDMGLRFDSYDHALKTAARGQGISLTMQPYMAEDFELGQLIDIFPKHHTRTIGHWYLVYPRDRQHVEKISSFKDWVLEEINADPNIAPLIDPAQN